MSAAMRLITWNFMTIVSICSRMSSCDASSGTTNRTSSPARDVEAVSEPFPVHCSEFVVALVGCVEPRDADARHRHAARADGSCAGSLRTPSHTARCRQMNCSGARTRSKLMRASRSTVTMLDQLFERLPVHGRLDRFAFSIHTQHDAVAAQRLGPTLDPEEVIGATGV